MSGIGPFQFEPTYPPGEELNEEDFEEGEEDETEGRVRIENTEWCICGHCVPTATNEECCCCQELE